MRGTDAATKVAETVGRCRRNHQVGINAGFEQTVPGGQGILFFVQAYGNHRADFRAKMQAECLETLVQAVGVSPQGFTKFRPGPQLAQGFARARYDRGAG